MKTRRLIKRSQSKRSQSKRSQSKRSKSKRTIKKYSKTRKLKKSGGRATGSEAYRKNEKKTILNNINKFNKKIKKGQEITYEELIEICKVLYEIQPGETKFYKDIDPKQKYYKRLKSAVEKGLENIVYKKQMHEMLLTLENQLYHAEEFNLTEDEKIKTEREINDLIKITKNMPSLEKIEEMQNIIKKCVVKHTEVKKKSLYEFVHGSETIEKRSGPDKETDRVHDSWYASLKPKTNSMKIRMSPSRETEFGFQKFSKGSKGSSINLSPIKDE
jgi:hypothetical protein